MVVVVATFHDNRSGTGRTCESLHSLSASEALAIVERASTCCPSCWHAPAGAVLIRDEKRGQDVVEAVPARRAPRRFLGGCPWQIER